MHDKEELVGRFNARLIEARRALVQEVVYEAFRPTGPTGACEYEEVREFLAYVAIKFAAADASDARVPAVYTQSNVTINRDFDADNTSMDEIADVLGTVIADLKTYRVLQ